MNARPVLARLLLGLGGVLVGLVLAEIAGRMLAPMPGEDLLFNAPEAAPPGMYQPDSQLLLVPVPGFRGEVASFDYHVDLRFNSLGIRGAEDLGPTPRWLAIGDSFALSVQVPEEKTFESLLGATIGASVLNAGVDGYSTWQALERYRRLESAAAADGVILVYFLGNDLTDNVSFPRLIASLPPGPRPLPQGIGASGPTRFAYRHSILFAYTRVFTQRKALWDTSSFQFRKFHDELQPFSRAFAPSLPGLVEASAAPLTQLRDEASARGDRLIVALAPPLYAMSTEETEKTLHLVGLSDAQPDAPRVAVRGLLDRLGIPTCDLSDSLKETERSGSKTYLRFDGHWSPAGHAAVAGALARCLGSP